MFTIFLQHKYASWVRLPSIGSIALIKNMLCYNVHVMSYCWASSILCKRYFSWLEVHHKNENVTSSYWFYLDKYKALIKTIFNQSRKTAKHFKINSFWSDKTLIFRLGFIPFKTMSVIIIQHKHIGITCKFVNRIRCVCSLTCQ